MRNFLKGIIMDIEEICRRKDEAQRERERAQYLQNLQEEEMKASLAHMKSADRKSNIALAISIIALIVAIIELIQ